MNTFSEKESLKNLLDTTNGEVLLEVVLRQINSDDESFEKKGDSLIEQYRNAKPQQRDAMDELLITLCGWSFQTLCIMTKEN